jgi:hypothetical protein
MGAEIQSKELMQAAVPSLLRRKETTLPTKADEARSSAARVRADASFKKEERAKDGAKAMMEYLDHGRMIRERTERLRALRLAKEAADNKRAADKKAESAVKPAAVKPAAGKRTGAKV